MVDSTNEAGDELQEGEGKSFKHLTIRRDSRHYKIYDTNTGEVVLKTTNIRDAEHYLELVEENDRLQRLLDARGIAPHRIYLLATDESKRGRVNLDSLPATGFEVVCFPVKIRAASAGWCRPVALFRD